MELLKLHKMYSRILFVSDFTRRFLSDVHKFMRRTRNVR